MTVDWSSILDKLIVLAVGSSATWIISNVTKTRSDLNAAFRKIRRLEKQAGIPANQEDDT